VLQARSYGSTSARLGADSQRKFDQCNVCLGRLIDPVASPDGWLYCRECIVKNLLQQKLSLEEQKRAHQAELAELATQAATAASSSAAAHATAFAKLEHGVASRFSEPAAAPSSASTSAASSSARGDDRSAEVPTTAELLHRRVTEKIDPRNRAEKLKDMERTSFWVPTLAPTAAATKTPAPDPHPRDPCSGQFLRAKQLISCRFTKAPEAALAAAAAGSGSSSGGDLGAAGSSAPADEEADGVSSAHARYMCPACLKGVVFQQMYLFSGCGHALCEACTKRFVAPAKRCFECSHEVRGKGDIVKLQQSGSAYVGHAGTVTEAKRWTPSLVS